MKYSCKQCGFINDVDKTECSFCEMHQKYDVNKLIRRKRKRKKTKIGDYGFSVIPQPSCDSKTFAFFCDENTFSTKFCSIKDLTQADRQSLYTIKLKLQAKAESLSCPLIIALQRNDEEFSNRLEIMSPKSLTHHTMRHAISSTGNDPNNNNTTANDIFSSTSTSYINIPYLKSHLQKCIRRGLTKKAVKTAWHLAHLDFVTLLRRLCVIAIEDVTLVSFFPTLVWIMVATSSGRDPWKPTFQAACWVMGAVKALCTCPTILQLNHKTVLVNKKTKFADDDHTNKVPLKKITRETIFKEENLNIRTNVFALLVRSAYGGMLGDQELLRDVAALCLNGDIKPVEIEVVPIHFHSISPLLKDDWLLESIDYHVSPVIHMLQNHFNNKESFEFAKIPIDELRNWMWTYRSGFNYRKCHSIECKYCNNNSISKDTTSNNTSSNSSINNDISLATLCSQLPSPPPWHQLASKVADTYCQTMIHRRA